MSLPSGQSAWTAADARTDHENFQRQFGNIFDDEMSVSAAAMVQPAAGHTDYFCVFCDQRDFSGREDVRRHYQHHLEYYPIVCSLCGSRATDVADFLKHHTSCHAGRDKAKYKRREVAHVERWLNGFLYAQSTIVSAFPPREQCPVCDKVFSAEQIADARPRRCTINRKIDHVHRHLCYLPYECVKCRDDEGKEFSVAYFESKAHSHIKLKHPDVDDQESRWFVFQKTISIPKLDNFVAGYLNRYGISMEMERRPIRKSLISDPNQVLQSGSESTGIDDDSNDFVASDDFGSNSHLIAQLTSPSCRSLLPVTQSRTEELIIPVSPEFVDTDSHDLTTEHFSPYFCIFCPEKLESVGRAHVHYGFHFDYHPIICLLCEQRFNDIENFTSHHKSSHEVHSDLKFEVREDFVVEKWIDDFLKFQKSAFIRKLLLSCSCAKFCPSCSKLNSNAMVSTTCTAHNETFFADHLKHHVNYLPYVCVMCKRNGKLVRISNLTVNAAAHVHKEHAIMDPDTVNQSSRMFMKVVCIPKIDDMIKSQIITRQTLFADTSVQPSREMRHLRINIPSANSQPQQSVSLFQKSNKANSMATMRVITEGKRMVLKQFEPRPPKIISKSIPQPQGTTHIRIHGGRVVNLPEARTTSMQPANSPHFRIAPMPRTRIEPVTGSGKWASSGRPRERVISHQRVMQPHVHRLQPSRSLMVSSALAAVPVTCLHCNKVYPSKRLLRLHSNKFHPGLQVSFATASCETR